MTRAAVIAAVAVAGATLAPMAYAGSADDGNAGLDALTRGSYSEAVRLFTRALKAGDLARDDQEFAYLNRGKAYLAEGKKTLAVADFKKATSLKPDDAEAQAALQTALHGAIVAQAVPPPPPVDPDAAWGPILILLNGYWVEQNPDPTSWIGCQWRTAHVIIACDGLAKNGKRSAASYQLDPATGKITYSQGGDYTPYTAPVEIGDKSFALDIETGGKYFRATYTPSTATTINVSLELFDANVWKPVKTVQMVQSTNDGVQALNWRAGKDKTHSFWKDLGASLAAGAAAGIVQGLQPQQ